MPKRLNSSCEQINSLLRNFMKTFADQEATNMAKCHHGMYSLDQTCLKFQRVTEIQGALGSCIKGKLSLQASRYEPIHTEKSAEIGS